MKLAVLADIHANFVAFQTVLHHIERWSPDAVIVAGDIINRGPRSVACLDLVQEKERLAGWQIVRGNHEDYILGVEEKRKAYSESERAFYQGLIWTYEKLADRMPELHAMPFQQSVTGPDGGEIRAVHASMQGNRIGIYPKTTDDELPALINPPPLVLCAGHTHRPLVRQINDTLVVNTGSVGLPFDGDTRASYTQLTWRDGGWQAEIIRLAYDLEKAERDYTDSGFLAEGGPLVPVVLDEMKTARSHLHQWTQLYAAAILAGEITMAESVARYMAEWS